jgi:hypothetical protein
LTIKHVKINNNFDEILANNAGVNLLSLLDGEIHTNDIYLMEKVGYFN